MLNTGAKYVFFVGMIALFTLPLVCTAYPEYPPFLNDWVFGIPTAFSVALFGFFFLGYNRGQPWPNRDTSRAGPVSLGPFSRQKVTAWLLPVLLFIVAFVYLVIGLDAYNFIDDEYQVTATAYGYLKTGRFLLWDFCSDEITQRDYLRAFPHTWLVAQSFNLFGLSEWSARIVSVFFGALFAAVGYIVFFYFTKDRLVTVVGVISCIVHSPLSILFRRCRMYSLLIPLALLLFFSLHKAVVSLRSSPFSIKRTLPSWGIAALLLLLNVLIHVNSLVILLYLPFFVLFLSYYEKKRVYLVLALLCLTACFVIALVGGFTDLLSVFTGHIAPFERLNYNYFKDLFRSPFPVSIGICCYLLAVGLLFSKNIDKETKTKLASLMILNLVGGVFFVFIANRYYAFTYMSFLTPTTTLLVLWTFSMILKRFDTRRLKAPLILAAGVYIVVGIRHPSQREQRLPDFKNAYAFIMKAFDRDKDELLIAQFPRCYYMRDFAPRVRRFNLGKRRSTKFGRFVKAISSAPSGFVVWEKRKVYHVDRRIHHFVESCFKARHTSSRQWRGMEIYRFNQRYPCVIKVRRMPPHVAKVYTDSPNRIDLRKPFTLSFWLRAEAADFEPPIALGTGVHGGILVESPKDKKGELRFRYTRSGPCAAVDTGVVNDGQWHLISLYQTGGAVGAEYGVYVDGGRREACRLTVAKKARVKFLVNNFRGEIGNIRLYDRVLSEAQQGALYAQGRESAEPALQTSTGAPVTPIGFWTIRR